MGHVSGALHAVSLQYMQRLMQLLLLLPPSCARQTPRLQQLLKLLYSLALLAYLAYILRWRVGLKYNVVYDVHKDHFSRFIDLANFVLLVLGHGATQLELLWGSRSARIAAQFEQLRCKLLVQLGCRVNLQRIRRRCNLIYALLLLRYAGVLGSTFYMFAYTTHSELLLYACYSELVMLLRFSEFTLQAALVQAFYQELCAAGADVVRELQRLRCDDWPLRSLSLQRLSALQRLHGLLWETLREIEAHFMYSLGMVMLKAFVDISVLPYWMFMMQDSVSYSPPHYCIALELCKLSEICVPCLLCTQCEQLQLRLRSIFLNVTNDRRNMQLNAALLSLTTQLGQQPCSFSAGGFLNINNETLGKFLFAAVTYLVLCIQFRLSFK